MFNLINTVLLAQNDASSIFGKINPPVGPSNLAPDNPLGALGIFMARSINLFLFVALILTFLYMMWGAFDWVTSSGVAENVKKAQGKITQAIIGFFVIIFALTVFTVIGGDVLGIIKLENGSWTFNIPTFGSTPDPTRAPAAPFPTGTPL